MFFPAVFNGLRFTQHQVTVAGELVGATLLIYLLLIAFGRLLKRRFGTRFGAIYQLFCIAFAPYVAIELLRPQTTGSRELGALSTLLGAGVFVRLMDQYFWEWYLAGKRKATIPKLIREVTNILLLLAVLLLVLQFAYDRQIPGLVTASGAVGLILGFALQDSLGNIIAGFALQIGRPFQVGDWLFVDNQHARAVEINWRSTRFISNDDVQLDVPNQQIVRQTIVNYHGGGALHAMRLEVGVDYETPPNRVKDILARAAAAARDVLSDPAPNVFLKAFGDSAITYEVRFWIDDHRLYNGVSDAVRTNIWYALHRQRIRMPYPTRTLHLERTHSTARTFGTDKHATTLELVAGQPIFRDMGAEHLRTLVERSPAHHYGRGETIIREGVDGASMFVLVQGEASVSVLMSGQPTRVASLRGGECFGEMSLLTGEKRSASVLAVSDCEVMEITKPIFGEIISRDAGLLTRLSELLAQRQLEMDGFVQAHAQQPALVTAKEEELKRGFLSKLKAVFGI